jgi:hypothetical protein
MPNLYNVLLNRRDAVIGMDDVVIGVTYSNFDQIGISVSPTGFTALVYHSTTMDI